MAKKSLTGLPLFRTYVESSLNFNSKKISTNASHFDVIIAGGGMVGTTLACTLGKNTKLGNRNILLLDSSKSFAWTPHEKYSNRVSALNLNTYTLLNKIGAWKHIADVRCSSVKSMQIWDAVSDAMISFNHDEVSKVAVHIVENDLLLHAVGKEMSDLKNVVKHEAKIKEYVLPQEFSQKVVVNTEGNETYTCDLLLGCDGAQSQVRKAMGVNYVSWNYNQTAVVATLKLSEANDNVVAWQRFLPNGPIAILPLANNLSSLVWCTTPEFARSLLELTEEEFADKVNDALWKPHNSNSIIRESVKGLNKVIEFFELPNINERQIPPKIVGVDGKSRAAFPLGFGHATNYVKQRVALVGDAAHRVHPLAGQGVNLGFGDISTLNDVLGEAVYSGRVLGQLKDLHEYETLRQRHNFPTMVAIDGLHKLYSTEFLPIVLVRSLGLQFTHALNPLKRVIMNHATQ